MSQRYTRAVGGQRSHQNDEHSVATINGRYHGNAQRLVSGSVEPENTTITVGLKELSLDIVSTMLSCTSASFISWYNL